jgi:hypothetical protein
LLDVSRTWERSREGQRCLFAAHTLQVLVQSTCQSAYMMAAPAIELAGVTQLLA